MKETKKLDKRITQIAKKLREMRKDSGYKSLEKFAFDHEISRIQYWRMEKGTNFTIETFLKVLDAHKISLPDFFTSLK
ncbi:MAG: hypothetical protein POELPBGB_01386 [Bacteroidia bacterium]|nr:hypothetical protein [Bacteroidia bacterium]